MFLNKQSQICGCLKYIDGPESNNSIRIIFHQSFWIKYLIYIFVTRLKRKKTKSRNIRSRVEKRRNALTIILSQKIGSPLISNRRKSRLSFSVDSGISLKNDNTVQNHEICQTNLAPEDNDAYKLARARHSVSNLNNKNGFSIDVSSPNST